MTKTTKTAEYVVILETEYYGPTVKHAIARTGDDRQVETTTDLGAARMLSAGLNAGLVVVGPDVASCNVGVWEVIVRGVDGNDWNTWTDEMIEAAEAIAKEHGIDSYDSEAVSTAGIDWLAEAADAVDLCVVYDEESDCLLLCKRVAD